MMISTDMVGSLLAISDWLQFFRISQEKRLFSSLFSFVFFNFCSCLWYFYVSLVFGCLLVLRDGLLHRVVDGVGSRVVLAKEGTRLLVRYALPHVPLEVTEHLLAFEVPRASHVIVFALEGGGLFLLGLLLLCGLLGRLLGSLLLVGLLGSLRCLLLLGRSGDSGHLNRHRSLDSNMGLDHHRCRHNRCHVLGLERLIERLVGALLLLVRPEVLGERHRLLAIQRLARRREDVGTVTLLGRLHRRLLTLHGELLPTVLVGLRERVIHVREGLLELDRQHTLRHASLLLLRCLLLGRLLDCHLRLLLGLRRRCRDDREKVLDRGVLEGLLELLDAGHYWNALESVQLSIR